MVANEFQCLFVFGVFVAGVVDKRLNNLTTVIFLTICAGDVTFGQAAFLHFAFGPAQIPRAVQISRFAALAGFLIFTAGLAIAPQQPISSVPFIGRNSLQSDRASENR